MIFNKDAAIYVHVDNKTLVLDDNNKVTPKISSKEDNGIYIGDDGLLHLQKGLSGGAKGTEEIYNLAGNGIGGTEEGSYRIEILRCGKTVTRLVQKPDDIKAPVVITDIITGILNWSDEDADDSD